MFHYNYNDSLGEKQGVPNLNSGVSQFCTPSSLRQYVPRFYGDPCRVLFLTLKTNTSSGTILFVFELVRQKYVRENRPSLYFVDEFPRTSSRPSSRVFRLTQAAVNRTHTHTRAPDFTTGPCPCVMLYKLYHTNTPINTCIHRHVCVCVCAHTYIYFVVSRTLFRVWE